MIGFCYRLLTGLLGVFAAYLTYALVVVPLLEGKVERARVEPQRIELKTSNRYEHLITSIFPEDDWVRGRCKILDAKQSILFFKEARQLESGDWEVKPFTMFLNPEGALTRSKDGKPSSMPIILRTEEGAYIRFEEGSSPNSPSGKFSGARMPGEVTVLRQESAAGANDSFEFVTRNIQMDQKQILAVNPVRFRYGLHEGSGHNLTIHLNQNRKARGKRRRTPLVRNVKTIELAHLDHILLRPDEEVAATDTSSTDGAAQPEAASPSNSGLKSNVARSPVRITCTGPFRLDFGKSQMVLFDQVHVEQLHADQMHDHLYCDRLEVNFSVRWSGGSKQGSVSSSDRIRFQEVRAFGGPARLLVDSRDAFAQAEYIRYHLRKRTIHCRSNVVIRDGTYQFTAPEMQYQLTLNNQLGTGWATGPGQVIGHPDDPEKNFRASWQSELDVQPHEGKKAISLHGTANIVLQGNQDFECEELHFWIWEKRKKGPRPRWTYFPAQLLGRRNVTMNSPEFAGEVDELRVFWPSPIQALPRESKGKPSKGKRSPNQDSLTSSSETPARFAGQTRSEKAADPDLVETRIVGTGRLAIANLTRKNKLRVFRVENSVSVKAYDLTPQERGQPPELQMVVEGDQIQVDATNQPNAYRVNVVGRPAAVRSDGVLFESEELNVDQEANMAWSNLPGKVTVTATDRAGERPFGPTPETSIQWNKRFEFDGSIIRLMDSIRFDGVDYLQSGEQVSYEGSTRELSAKTNRHVHFRKNESKPTSRSGKMAPLKIVEFQLLDDAFIKATTRESISEVNSIDEIEARAINVRTDTGDAQAVGPGNVRSVRKGQAASGEASPTSVADSLQTSSSELSYLQIAFAGRIVGNVFEREATVMEKVRCVYGPAADWNTRYDPDETNIVGEEVYLECNQLKFNQWRPTGSPRPLIEIAAVGNTEIEGKKFRALATQLTYTEQNEIVLLEGLQREFARIWFRKNERQPWQYGEARKFRYQKKTSEIIGSEDLKEMRFLQFESPQRRRR